MPHTIRLPNGHEISDDRDRLDMEFIHAALENAYWAIGRPRALTERAWANCLPFGVYATDRAMIGFARVMTDYTFRGHLADVFIAPAARGLGLGKTLVRTIMEHPELATVGTWTLNTSDAHGLYVQFGFRTVEADAKSMILHIPRRDEPA